MTRTSVFAGPEASVWLWTRPLQLPPLNLSIVPISFCRITQSESTDIITSACFRNSSSLPLFPTYLIHTSHPCFENDIKSHLPCVGTKFMLCYVIFSASQCTGGQSQSRTDTFLLRGFSLLPYLSWCVVVSQAAPHPTAQCPGLRSYNAITFFHCIFFHCHSIFRVQMFFWLFC